MPVYVSDASRLHALLTALMQQNAGQSLRAAWSNVLNVPPPEVQYGSYGLPRVAGLVMGAERDAHRAEEQISLPVRSMLIDEWVKPVWVPGGQLDAALQSFGVSPEALAYLDSVARVLQRAENQAELPGADELAELLEQVTELAQSVEASDDLPTDVKQALLRRIAQVRAAIDFVRVGGPEGVQDAVEHLLGATVVRAGRMPTATAKKVWHVALAVFAVFAAGPQVQASLEAWPKVIEALASGPHEASGSSTDHEDDAGSASGDDQDRR